MLAIDVIGPDDWERFRLLRLASLGDAPDAFYSTLAEWSGEGDTEERWRTRLNDVPLNLVATVQGIDAGIVSALVNEDGDAELISMWVSPRFRGQGVGDRLVGKVVGWARAQGLAGVTLGVKADNQSAIRLYKRNGFVDSGWYSDGSEDEARAEPPPYRRMSRAL